MQITLCYGAPLEEAQLYPWQFRLTTATAQVPCRGAGLIQTAQGQWDVMMNFSLFTLP